MTVKKAIAATVAGAALMLATPFIEEKEKVVYRPYYDIAGVLTVCAGITGPDVIKGKTYTKEECRALNMKHIKRTADAVDKVIKVEIPNTMRAAMYSFAFNAGTGAFRNSTMLKKINRGDLVGACNELKRWVYYTEPKTGKRKVSKGLANRRADEFEYCIIGLKK